MMEPDVFFFEDDFLYRSDDEEDDIEQNASQNVDEEKGCPVVSLEVPSWLQIDSDIEEDEIDDYRYLNPFITSSASTRDATSNESPMKPRVSFHQQATVYYIPLPTPEEKQAAFYSFNEIAQFRSNAEREVMQQYVDEMMNRPLINPFNPRSEGEGGDNVADEEEERSLPTRGLHHDDTVQDCQSQLIRRKISEDEDDDENRLEQGTIEQHEVVPATKGWPTLFLPPKKTRTQRSPYHHVTKHSLTLVAGFCILTYFYTR